MKIAAIVAITVANAVTITVTSFAIIAMPYPSDYPFKIACYLQI
jgi:hypothetical protein